MANYQWYPGHMTKAKRMMQEDIKLIDLIIELVDARIPQSSRNPDIDELGKNKARIILLNKSDLADSQKNKQWMTYFNNKGLHVVEVNSKSGAGLKSIQGVVQEACKEKIERDRKRGILNRPVRAMVVGIPNVGKSTFINSFAGRACTKTGNKPGVTKGKQWIRLNKSLELLDTPGILWPKFEDQQVGLRLAMIGSINDEIIHLDELAYDLIHFLTKEYTGLLENRYQISSVEGKDDYEKLKEIFTTFPYDGEYVINSIYSTEGIYRNLLSFRNMFLLLFIVFLSLSILLISNFMMNSVLDYKKNIGILRAFGTTKKDIFKIFFTQMIGLVFLLFVFSFIGMKLIIYYLNGIYDVSETVLFYFNIRIVLLFIIYLLVITITASLLPILRMLKIKPVEAIRNE